MRCIDADGSQVGIITTGQALNLARTRDLDLVEISPNAQPPVCRIMDFGKYVYEESKKTSHAKATASKIKEIKLSARIDQHDFYTKLRHAEEFLDEGAKVKLRLKFRGREMAHTEIGFDVIKKAIDELSTMGHPDAEPKLMGKQINIMLTPHPANKRKPKWIVRDEAPAHHPEPKHSAPPAPAGS